MAKSSERVGTDVASGKAARIAVLGSLRLETPHEVLDSFGSRHAATILAILALHPEPVSRGRLSAELWPGEDEEVVRPRLRQELFRLKKALGETAYIVLADRELLSLRRQCVSTDVEEFLALVQAGRSVEGERRVELWTAAADVYKDDVLIDYSGEWLNHERATLQGVRRRLLLNLIQLLIEGGRAADAVEHARVLTRQDSGDEAAHAALAQAMFCSGDVSGAREHLRRVEARLRADGRNGGEALTRVWRMIESPQTIPSESKPAEAKPAEAQTPLGRPFPIALHPMFGRDAEIRKILSIIDDARPESARLLTIVGFGGMGKTRLAVEVAQKIAIGGKRLIGFVSLIEVESVEVMLQNIAAVVCPSRRPTQDSYGMLSAELDGKDLTLVLDNFEELIPTANSTIERLLNEHPGLRLLVTSRAPLGILGEQTFPLAPLPMPAEGDPESELLASPSVALFLDQTMRVRPDFTLDEGSLASVVKLMHAVEGIPLAILLAACRMRAISPHDAERAIQDRLAFLSGPKGGFESRHRTMRACIEWSSDALPEEVRAFWKRLAIFHGGWTLGAAEAVLEEGNALDYLEILCDSSLVHRQQVAGETRYAMFEPVRQFAEELFQPQDREIAASNQAKYCVEFVESTAANWTVNRGGRIFDTIEAEMDNIRAALSWSLENNPSYAQRLGMVLRVFWADGGWHAEGRQWLDRILALPEDTWEPRRRMLTLLSAGIMSMDQADFATARKRYLEASGICERSLDPVNHGWVDLNLAHLDVLRGFVAKAVPIQEKALAAFTEVDHLTGIAHASSDLGQALVRIGQRERGLELLRRAIALRMQIGWENGVAFANAALGAALLKVGEHQEAYDCLMTAREIALRAKDARILLDVLSELPECCFRLQREEECAQRLGDFRDLCRKVGDRLGSVNCDIRAALYELAKGNPLDSMRFARRALDAAVRLDVPIAELEALRVFAAIAFEAGRREDCHRLARGIATVGESLGVSAWPTRDARLQALISQFSGGTDTREPLADMPALLAAAKEIERAGKP